MSAGPNRVERMLNLLACLLDTRRPLTRDELVRQVSGYPPEAVAYRRAFERDKETLRAMGVPLVVETLPSGEQGYRVPPDEYFLPDLGLSAGGDRARCTSPVSAVLLGDQTGHGALMKFGGGLGLDAEGAPTAPIGTLPLEPALPVLFEAFRRRAPVTFEYRGESRTVEPWGLSARRGHWYLVGHDRGRDAMRTFRADRLGDDLTVGAPDSFRVPDDFSPDASLDAEPWQYGEDPPVTARLLVDAGHGRRCRRARRPGGRGARRRLARRRVRRRQPAGVPIVRARPARPRRDPRARGAARRPCSSWIDGPEASGARAARRRRRRERKT